MHVLFDAQAGNTVTELLQFKLSVLDPVDMLL